MSLLNRLRTICISRERKTKWMAKRSRTDSTIGPFRCCCVGKRLRTYVRAARSLISSSISRAYTRRRKPKTGHSHQPYYPSAANTASYRPPHQPVPHYLQVRRGPQVLCGTVWTCNALLPSRLSNERMYALGSQRNTHRFTCIHHVCQITPFMVHGCGNDLLCSPPSHMQSPIHAQPQPMTPGPQHAMFATARGYGGYGAMGPGDPRLNSMHPRPQQQYQQPPFYPNMSMMARAPNANAWQTQTQNNKTLEVCMPVCV